MTNKKAIGLVLGAMCFALTAGICVQIKTVNNTSSKVSQNYEENNLRAEVLKYKEKYDNLLKETEKIDVQLQEQIDSATKNFRFEVYAMGKDPIICPRLNDLSVTVIDSRVNSSNWKLYASINHDLESGDGDALKDSLVFVDDDGNINVLSSTPTLVYTGVNNGGNILSTSVSWEEEKGILLQLLEPLEINTYYDAEIIWSIEE